MSTILLIEDDLGIAHPLSLYIKKAEYRVVHCEHGDDALKSFQECNPTLVVLDINLPGKNGFELCEEIREFSQVPIIVLSARNSEEDKLKLFELGADDYVTKPFSSGELMARISAVIKRSKPKKKSKNEQILNHFGTIFIDREKIQVFADEEEIPLTKTEFQILDYIIQNASKTIKRESIMKDVMGYNNYAYDRTLDTHIKNLRKKLENHIIISTVRGIGYTVKIPNNS
ncbi:response regulator transcription factor [Candidatus Gracilibacteria bacterium]|nr:response regulator transcription factor [Candidatus Gracilibacteria bacterium]